jgi:hypothetical protein
MVALAQSNISHLLTRLRETSAKTLNIALARSSRRCLTDFNLSLTPSHYVLAMPGDSQIQARGAFSRFEGRTGVTALAATLAFAVTAFAPQVLNDGDTFMHIAAGGRMLADHAVLYRDPFSYTFAGAPWQAHEWLAEVAMAVAYAAGGWSGLLLIFAFAAAATAGLLAYHLGRWLDWPAQAIITVIALSCMTPSLLARPHLLALPLLALWTSGLLIARSEGRAPSLALLPVMTIWVNIHGSFLLGLALAAGLALEALASSENRGATLRGWGVFVAGALAAALINPHFLQGLLFPVAMLGAAKLANISEWQAIDFSQLQPMELAVLAALYFIVTRGVKIPPLRAVIVLVLLHMAFQHQRHQIVFALVAPLFLAEPFSRALAAPASVISERTHRVAAVTATGGVLLVLALAALRIFVPAVRTDSPVAPISALAHVPPAVRTQRVLNDYSFGGYLIFEGVRPFVDSRVELYGDSFLARYEKIIESDPGAVNAALRDYDIRWTMLGRHSRAVAVMDGLRGWHRLYADDYAVVHIRDK